MKLHEEFKFYENLWSSLTESHMPKLWKNPDGVEIDLTDSAAFQKELEDEKQRFLAELRQELQKEPRKAKKGQGKPLTTLQLFRASAKRNNRTLADEISLRADEHINSYKAKLERVINPPTTWYHKKTAYDMTTEEGALAYIDRMAINNLGSLSTPERVIQKLQQLKAEVPAKLNQVGLQNVATKVNNYIDDRIKALESGDSADAMKVNSKRTSVIRQTSKRPYDLTNSLHIHSYIVEKTKDILAANPGMSELAANIAVCDEIINDLSKDKTNPAVLTVIKTFEALRNKYVKMTSNESIAEKLTRNDNKMKLHEEFKLFEDMWYRIDDAIAASRSNTIFALVQYWKPRHKGGPERISMDGIFVDKAEALDRYALVSNHPSLGDKLIRIDLVQFTNLSKDEIDSIRAYDYAKVFSTAKYTVIASTSSKGSGSSSYKYYYVVCVLEEAFSNPTVLSAGTIKIDVSKVSAHETPEELAMTDYFDRTGIAYSDDWADDMWDYLTRYVYEIDATTYETESGLPKTDADILKYVEDSLADYEE